MKINKIALAISLTAVSSISHAALTGLEGANWSADTFGDGTSDIFATTSDPGQYPSGIAVGARYSSMSAIYDPDYTYLYTGSDYSPSEIGGSLDFDVYNYGNQHDTIVLSVKRGAFSSPAVIENASATLDGVTNNSYFETNFVDGDIAHYVWTGLSWGAFSGGHETKQISWSTVANHRAVDAVAVSTSASAVPVPAAAWLFGSALLGLVGIKRRQ